MDRGGIPVVLVDIQPGVDPHLVQARILKNILSVSIVDTTDLGSSQLSSMVRGIPWLLVLTWSLSVIFIGVVFAIAVNERQREIGVLRVLGSTRRTVFRSLLLEGSILALVGGLGGIMITILVDIFFREQLVQVLDLPLTPFAPVDMFLLSLVSLGLTLSGVSLAVFLPAWRISRLDPVVALRG